MTVFYDDGQAKYLHGDCRAMLRDLPAQSVHLVVTSPPYWGLRAYDGVEPTIWGGDPECDHGEFTAPTGYQGHRGKRGQVAQTKWPSNDTYPQAQVGWGNPELGPYAANVRGQGGTTLNPQTMRTDGGGVVAAGQFCLKCGAWRGMLGLEPTVDLFVEHLVEVFREVRRVLRDDGTLWLNMGDSFFGSGGSGGDYLPGGIRDGQPRVKPSNEADKALKGKDLCMVPARVALALQADGWYLRSDIAWIKTQAMPESVLDRPTQAWEHIFLLTKRPNYFYDVDAVRERHQEQSIGRYAYTMQGVSPGARQPGGDLDRREEDRGLRIPNPLGRNQRNWWLLTLEPSKESHFAVFPRDLVRRCLSAGTSERGCCPTCGRGWVRVTTREYEPSANHPGAWNDNRSRKEDRWHQVHQHGFRSNNLRLRITDQGWRPGPGCTHYDLLYAAEMPKPRRPKKRNRIAYDGGRWFARVRQRPGKPDWPTVPATVLDPFVGTGRTVSVAKALGRYGIGIDLSAKYLEIAVKHSRQLMMEF